MLLGINGSSLVMDLEWTEGVPVLALWVNIVNAECHYFSEVGALIF